MVAGRRPMQVHLEYRPPSSVAPCPRRALRYAATAPFWRRRRRSSPDGNEPRHRVRRTPRKLTSLVMHALALTSVGDGLPPSIAPRSIASFGVTRRSLVGGG